MTAVDPYGIQEPGIAGSPRRGFSITKHDTNEIAHVTRGLCAYTTPGKCAVVTAGGDAITIYLALGAVFPIQAKIVKDTGTDAAGITGLY